MEIGTDLNLWVKRKGKEEIPLRNEEIEERFLQQETIDKQLFKNFLAALREVRQQIQRDSILPEKVVLITDDEMTEELREKSLGEKIVYFGIEDLRDKTLTDRLAKVIFLFNAKVFTMFYRKRTRAYLERKAEDFANKELRKFLEKLKIPQEVQLEIKEKIKEAMIMNSLELSGFSHLQRFSEYSEEISQVRKSAISIAREKIRNIALQIQSVEKELRERISGGIFPYFLNQ